MKTFEDDLADQLQNVNIQEKPDLKTPKASRSKSTNTPGLLQSSSKNKCWFLTQDKIDPSRYAEYIGDFHFMSNRQLQLNRDKQTRMLFTVFNETVFENMVCS